MLQSGDTIAIFSLGDSVKEYVTGAGSFELISGKSNSDWLIYYDHEDHNTLKLVNLSSGSRMQFTGVQAYTYSSDGSYLYLREVQKESNKINIAVFDFSTGRHVNIWDGFKIKHWLSDPRSPDNFAFVTEEMLDNKTTYSLWYYRTGQNKAIKIADDHASGLGNNLQIARVTGFSDENQLVYFAASRLRTEKKDSAAPKVDVWSYTDPTINPEQFYHSSYGSYLCCANMVNKNVIQLQHLRTEEIKMPSNGRGEWLLLVDNGPGSVMEYNWNRFSKKTLSIVSCKTGKIRQIGKDSLTYTVNNSISPNGNYITWYDAGSGNYFCYSVRSGVTHKITNDKGGKMIFHQNKRRPIRSWITWLAGEEKLLVLDEFDIWLLDPEGKADARNVTNGYGFRHKIAMGLIGNEDGRLHAEDVIVIKGFDERSKESGFFQVSLDREKDPVLLSMSKCGFEGLGAFGAFDPGKAKDTSVYLVKRTGLPDWPNYFLTTDFRSFAPASHLAPQKTYNWLTAQLVNWQGLDGKTLQGLLYKPENFDPKKKYPVIVYVYETFSDHLYDNVELEYTGGPINIPYYVSNGYLVFMPDIPKDLGSPGPSILSSIVSAVNHFHNLPFIDCKRLGIQGGSFGGWEVDYIVTHTRLFAAAVSCAGPSDLISAYNSISQRLNGQFFYEIGQYRIGKTLWQRPDLYVKYSPVFYADRVTTPILLNNNISDDDVLVHQGIEFFLSLRRLGKRAWMLQYDGSGHVINGIAEQTDYFIRTKQFFDHYLENKPAPRWMTKGIPAEKKGIDNGYDFDPDIKTPREGVLITR